MSSPNGHPDRYPMPTDWQIASAMQAATRGKRDSHGEGRDWMREAGMQLHKLSMSSTSLIPTGGGRIAKLGTHNFLAVGLGEWNIGTYINRKCHQ